MPVVVIAKFRSAPAAHAARWRLLEYGIPAGISEQASPASGWMLGQSSPTEFHLLLGDHRLKDDALAVLEAFDPRNGPDLDEGWEDALEPDFSKLDPRRRPACPHCGAIGLMADHCNGCHQPVDIASLVISQFGPEALEACYPDPEGPPEDIASVPDAWLQRLALPCEGCGLSLAGLPSQGACPKCKRPYEKREQLARISGP